MPVVSFLEPRDVQCSEDLAAREIAHHDGGACPALDAGTEVLTAVHLYRGPRRERRANGVGAAGELGPAGPRHEAYVRRRLERARIAFRLEDHSTRVGEHHDGPRLREEVAGLDHDRSGRFDELPVTLPQEESFLAREDERRLRTARIDTCREAAPPGTLDEVAQEVWRRAVARDEALPHVDDLPLLLRIGEALGVGIAHVCPAPRAGYATRLAPFSRRV